MIELARLSPEERQRRVAKAQAEVTPDEQTALAFLNAHCGWRLGPLALSATLGEYLPNRMQGVSEAAATVEKAMRRSQRILEGEDE